MKVRNAIPDITYILFAYPFSMPRQIKTDCLILLPRQWQEFSRYKVLSFSYSSPRLLSTITSYHQKIAFSIYCHLQKRFYLRKPPPQLPFRRMAIHTGPSIDSLLRMHSNKREAAKLRPPGNYFLCMIFLLNLIFAAA